MIDWGRVNELCFEIGQDDFDEVVELFLEEADEVAATLQQPMQPAEIETALHFLKGSALNLGFQELARLCQAGEKAAAATPPLDVDLAQVFETYESSKTAFLSGLDRVKVA